MTMSSAESRWPARLLALARYSAAGALVLLAIAGPGFRFRLLPLSVAVKGVFPVGVAAAFAALVLGAAGLLAGSAGQRWPRTARNWLATGFGAAVLLACAYGWLQLRAAPMLHDVSTDTTHPPVFVEAVALRSADRADNSADYVRDYTVGETAVNAPALQQQAYPDLRPVMLGMKPPQAFAAAESAARALGWRIIAAVPAEGRIEATVTSLYFGFRDDIAIRVRSELNGRGSVVDVRSAARVGANDGGSNARHIRAFAARLKQAK
jgi:uncharacterized protein (DUF1499 family)